MTLTYPLMVDHLGTAYVWVPGTGYRFATAEEIAAGAVATEPEPLPRTPSALLFRLHHSGASAGTLLVAHRAAAECEAAELAVFLAGR